MVQNKEPVLRKNGQAAAAMMAAMIAILSLSISHLSSVLSEESKTFFHEVGKAWIPGADGIGPYSGKETMMLIGWGVGWILLYYGLRNRDVRLSYYTVTFIVGVGISTLLVWTPFVHFVK